MTFGGRFLPVGSQFIQERGSTVAESQRKKNEDALLLALACGATVESAARQCDLCERTIYRRLRDREFRIQLHRVRADMVARTAAMLTAAGLESVRTLLELQKGTSPAAIRLGAARAILEIGLKLREAVDLQLQIDELEGRVDEIARTRDASSAG